MRCFARCRLWDGSLRDIMPGQIIGRSGSADIVIDDPRVSEAHAMLSLRSGRLVLLSLRRMIMVAGERVSEVELREGLQVHFADDLCMTVEAITAPASVLGIQGEGIAARPLAQVSSLYGGGMPRVVGRFEPGADAHLWFLEGQCRLSIGGGAAEQLAAGSSIEINGSRMELRDIAIAAAGHATTELVGSIGSPLTIITSYDSVEIRRPQRPAVTFGGHSGRVVCELAAYEGAVPWRLVADQLWQNTDSVIDQRRRWDVIMVRLRRKLADLGVRSDLVRSDGAGQVRLVLYEGDRVEDRG